MRYLDVLSVSISMGFAVVVTLVSFETAGCVCCLLGGELEFVE